MYNINPFYGQENLQSISFSAGHIDAPYAQIMTVDSGGGIPRINFGDGFASATTVFGNQTLDTGHWFQNGQTANTITINVARLEKIKEWQYDVTGVNDGIIGNLDLSNFKGLWGNVFITGHKHLTGITFPSEMSTTQEFLIFRAFSCDIQGHIELSGMTNIGRTSPNSTSFQMYGNNGITSVNFPITEKLVDYSFRSCGLNEVDLSMVSGYTGFDFSNNPTLSSITFTMSGHVNTITGSLNLYQCAFKEIDFTPLGDKFGGKINFYENPYLTAVTFPTTTANVTEFQCQSCGFVEESILDLRPIQNLKTYIVIRSNNYGELYFPSNDNLITTFVTRSLKKIKTLDLSPLSGISTSYNFSFCSLLTGVTFPTGNLYEITGVNFSGCDLKELDMTNIPQLSTTVLSHTNSNLTAVTFPNNSYYVEDFDFYNCDLREVDFTPLSSYGGNLNFYSNPNLSAITLSPTTETVTSVFSYGCDLGFVNFRPLSAGTQDGIVINLDNNSTTFTECNQILDSLSGMGAQNGTLYLSGSSASPTGAEGYDTSSGGINGFAIYEDLINNSGWTIFMSGLTV